MLRRWISLWFVLSIMFTSANLLTPASALAETRVTGYYCYGSTCNGLNPGQYSCDRGAQVVASANGNTLRLYYSFACNTYYATAYNPTSLGSGARVWMADNYAATVQSNIIPISGMWTTGRACMIFGNVPDITYCT